MLTDITTLLLQLVNFLLDLYIMTVLLRFLLQVVRADFYNPVSQAIVKATTPLLRPLRRIIPGWRGMDMSCLVLALALQFAQILIPFIFHASMPSIVPVLVSSVFMLVGQLLSMYFYLIIAIFILSWVALLNNSGMRHPLASLIAQLTEPVLEPIRRVIPPLGMLDLSVMVAFFLIKILQIVLAHTHANVLGLLGY